MVTNLEETLLDKVRELPDNKKREVLDFAESLREKHQMAGKSLAGLWSDLSIDIPDEEWKKIRAEMWANFPRDV